jgi:hypothetical protein
MKPEILSIIIKAGTHPIGCSECDLLRLEGENHICVPLGRNVLGIGKDCPFQEEKPESEGVDMSKYEVVAVKSRILNCTQQSGEPCALDGKDLCYLCNLGDNCYRLKTSK